MDAHYVIGPKIGVARLGNSPNDFYLEPDAAGALPLECDDQGNVHFVDGGPVRVSRFKDAEGRVRRQGALFRIYRIDDANPDGVEVTLDSDGIAGIEWTVHLANKKACWYNFAELEGNLLLGGFNSYKKRKVPLRNATVTDPSHRKKLIIDPGPRTLDGPGQSAVFDSASVPSNYQHASFPNKPKFGERITSLGNLLTDSAGRLIVLGGSGDAGGDQPISSFAGADTWDDDISDGPVTCALTFKDGTDLTLQAWCIVGSPKFVPEVVNIVTLADTAWDCAVRNMDAVPDLFANGRFNDDYVANFDRDIAPILTRPGAYRWVANTPSMNSMSPPPFDPRDAGDAGAPVRKAYFERFRKPSPQDEIGGAARTLFSDDDFPLMPLNSGSNSVSNTLTDKFLTLTLTQYFLLGQWRPESSRSLRRPPKPSRRASPGRRSETVSAGRSAPGSR